MDKSISIAEAVGLLRRMHREFQIFEQALNVANELHEADKKITSLNNEIDRLGKTKIELEQEIEESKQQVIFSNQTLQANEQTCNERINQTEMEIAAKIKKVDADIERRAIDGEKRIAALNNEIKHLSTQRNELQENNIIAEKQLNAIKAKIQQTKQALIDSLD